MEPAAVQEPSIGKFIKISGPISIEDWHMLDLGNGAMPPVLEQESENVLVSAVPSQTHKDGVLLRVTVRLCGREVCALIDCGASRCYLTPQVVLRLGLQPIAESATLELGDGTRVPSSGCLKNQIFTMESQTFSQDFTITQLMPGVDMVLGMTWLESVNPIINWSSHMLYVRSGKMLYPIKCAPAEESTKIGTVKHLDSVATENEQPQDNSLELLVTPQFWDYNDDKRQWRSVHRRDSSTTIVEQLGDNKDEEMQSEFCDRVTVTPRGVLKRNVRTTTGQRQLVSLKHMRKLAKQGETCYLMMLRSFGKLKTQKAQLAAVKTTQRQKRSEQMKQGPAKNFKSSREVMIDVVEQASSEVRSELRNIIHDYQDVFPEKLPKGVPPEREVEHEIATDPDAVPPSRAPYRLGPQEVAEMEEQIKDLLSQGYIRPSCSPYGAPILFVPKKDGRWRMCVDYRLLNRQTKKDKYPIPRIDDLLDKLGRSQYFTKLDLASGYHQIAMKAEDVHKTAFRTTQGHYEFLVMPFGLTNAPATFQRLMNKIFKRELGQFVCVYLDDILVFSSSLEDHVKHVRVALERLLQAQLYGRLHKCEFFKHSVEYLGFEVSSTGIKASVDKVKIVQDWPEPQNVHDVRSFLGLVNYYRRFIRDYSQIAKPLTDLTKDKVKFKWAEDQVAAFNKLKFALTTAPILRLPNFENEFILTTDASSASVGAVIEQDFGRGLQPLAYDSKKLNATESRYSAYERELLGMIYAIGKWRHYLEGCHFIIRTDHSSLRFLPNQPSVNRRIWKWIAILQTYDVTITHIPGVRNPADPLTRRAWQEDRNALQDVKTLDHDLVEKLRVQEDASDQDIQSALDSVFKQDQAQQLDYRGSVEEAIDQSFPAVDSLERVPALYVSESTVELDQTFAEQMLEELKNESPYDEIIQRLQDPNQSSTWVRSEGIFRIQGKVLKIHRPHRDDEIDQDLPYWRTVVPQGGEYRSRILQELHSVPYSGHPGVNTTILRVRHQFWWKGMIADTRDFVLSCPVCQQEKGSHQLPGGLLQPLEIPTAKWDQVVIDFVTCLPDDDGSNAVLTVVDKATKFVYFIPCSTEITGKETAKLFWQVVGSTHGIPSVIISDRDVRFTSQFWQELWRILGTRLRMGTAYHPQSQGQVERYNQVLSQLLQCTIHEVGDSSQWTAIIPTIQFAANAVPNRSTGYSPFFLNFGRHPVTPVQLLDDTVKTRTESVATFLQRLRDTFSTAQKNMTSAAQRMKGIVDRRRRDVVFSTGAWVLLSTRHLKPVGSAKLNRRFVGPFKVIERIGQNAYRLDLPSTWTIHPVFHVSLLKDFRTSRFHPTAATTLPELVPATPTEPRVFNIERILRWRWMVGQRRRKEYLVLWSGYPLEEATWEPTSHFTSPSGLRGLLRRDNPPEDKRLPS